MQNTGLDDNLRYANSTTLMTESEEELKSLLMKGKEKRKNWLKIQLSKNKNKGEESRWQRNRTGRPLSLLQIHWKNNWTVNKVHKTTIASSGHQAPRKAAHCLRREVGQNIKDKKGDKRARVGDPSREGSLNRGSFQSPGNPRTGGSGGSFQISEGNLTGRKN